MQNEHDDMLRSTYSELFNKADLVLTKPGAITLWTSLIWKCIHWT